MLSFDLAGVGAAVGAGLRQRAERAALGERRRGHQQGQRTE